MFDDDDDDDDEPKDVEVIVCATHLRRGSTTKTEYFTSQLKMIPLALFLHARTPNVVPQGV